MLSRRPALSISSMSCLTAGPRPSGSRRWRRRRTGRHRPLSCPPSWRCRLPGAPGRPPDAPPPPGVAHAQSTGELRGHGGGGMLCLCRIFYFARQPFFAYFEAISQLLADNSGAADLAHIPPPHREGSAVGHLLRFLEKSSLMVLAFQFPGRTVQEFGTPISAWGVGGLNPHPPFLSFQRHRFCFYCSWYFFAGKILW